MEKKVRESRIEKKLEILINLGNFESLKVGSSFSETIEWITLEERQKKLDAITENLKREVAKDINDILESYELKQRSTTEIKVAGKTPDRGLKALSEVDEPEEDDEDFDL